jgi:hypothetical protein
VRLCKRTSDPRGVNDDELQQEFGDDISQLEPVINTLLKQVRERGGVLIFVEFATTSRYSCQRL